MSIATFYDPDCKALVDPRALGASGADCICEPVLAGDHIVGRIERSFGYRKKIAAPAHQDRRKPVRSAGSRDRKRTFIQPSRSQCVRP